MGTISILVEFIAAGLLQTITELRSAFIFLRFYLFTFRGEGGEKGRKTSLWLLLMHPLLGTWPTTQACALTGLRTGKHLFHRPALNPLSYTSQGYIKLILITALSVYNPPNSTLFDDFLIFCTITLYTEGMAKPLTGFNLIFLMAYKIFLDGEAALLNVS